MFETRILNCEKHGEYEGKFMQSLTNEKEYFAMNGAPCPKCEEDRKVIEEERRKEQAREQFKQHVKNCQINMKKQTPKRFQNASFDTYICQNKDQRQALNICKSYCDKFQKTISETGGGLIFSGKVGTGKTHLALSIGRHLANIGVYTLYISLSDLVREVRATWKGDGHEDFVFRKYQQCDLLIIDEVGVQAGSENERNILFEIIDGRYKDMLPTIVISNLEREKICDMISERSVDRITQGGALVPFTWKSERGAL